MILMYDTAARCCELLGMKIKDLRLNSEHPIAYLHGKGGKTRTVPLLPNTVQHCKRYLRKFHHGESADSEKFVFYTVIHGTQNCMSHDNAADFIERYGLMASQNVLRYLNICTHICCVIHVQFTYIVMVCRWSS